MCNYSIVLFFFYEILNNAEEKLIFLSQFMT